MSEMFDIVFVGGGPAGYVGAIKAAQLGLKTACIEKRGTLGGTCLNVGCIPSKALLQSSHKYAETLHGIEDHGIKISKVDLDLTKMMERKTGVVQSLCKGIEMLFAKNKVTYFKGAAELQGNGSIKINTKDGDSSISAKNIVLATGSDIVRLPNIEIDEKRIVSSTGALELDKVPGTMLVIGGGYIGLEMGSVWSRLGSKVTVVEFADRIVPQMDSDISKEFKKLLEKQGLTFKMSTKVTGAKSNGKTVDVNFETVADGAKSSEKYDIVLVCIGRKPYTEGLGLEKAGVALDERNRIKINSKFETSASGVYAIGDVVEGPMLAHKAEEEGIAVAEIIAGQHPHINYSAIPGVVYTYPEAASVGKTEDELKKEGVEYKVGKFSFMANSRARANGDTDGFVKVIVNKKTDTILGAHIIGVAAGELIQEFVMGIEFKASSEDIARISHSHPGLYEAVKEACLAAYDKAIHS